MAIPRRLRKCAYPPHVATTQAFNTTQHPNSRLHSFHFPCIIGMSWQWGHAFRRRNIERDKIMATLWKHEVQSIEPLHFQKM